MQIITNTSPAADPALTASSTAADALPPKDMFATDLITDPCFFASFAAQLIPAITPENEPEPRCQYFPHQHTTRSQNSDGDNIYTLCDTISL